MGVVSVINQFCQVEGQAAPWRRFKKRASQGLGGILVAFAVLNREGEVSPIR